MIIFGSKGAMEIRKERIKLEEQNKIERKKFESKELDQMDILDQITEENCDKIEIELYDNGQYRGSKELNVGWINSMPVINLPLDFGDYKHFCLCPLKYLLDDLVLGKGDVEVVAYSKTKSVCLDIREERQ